ncbi:N-acetylglucosamine-6-phosphate deacetylase [Luteitalea pratensis]|uniref:N-acetylglucosamine-6-phosphate deacetylase n=1 Tax=Luteitalea pratensis TaxID=1855912 RepID=A0A143PQD4_LUTPR|nr:amidohydrolase family protein [Luteitalea pratensis]AMY10328.1 N-acetylglucosamine-6-phosphate deacetylase [Luteitalea pratensis]
MRPRVRIATWLYVSGTAAALLALATTTTTRAQGPAKTYAIKGARIVTVSGPIIDNGTVVIADGKIVSVGASAPVPAGAEVIDGTGLEVSPGFFDAMSELGLTEIGAVNATNDITEVGAFNPQVDAATAVHPATDHIPVARANGITHAVAVPGMAGMGETAPRGGTGPVIGGQASAFHLDGWTIEEMLISRSVGMVVNWPSLQARTFDFATFSSRTRPYREVKEEQAKQTREIARWISDARDYRAARARGADRVERNLKLEALGPYAAGEKPWLVRAGRERDIRDAVSFFVDTHKQKIVLVGAEEAWKVAALLAEKKVPVIVGPTQALPDSDDDPYDATMAAPAVLHKAGVTFALSTYSSSDARNLPYEIGTAVGFGLPRDVALRAITLAPAQILGLGAFVGSVEPGKIANLVVSRGDPLEIRSTITHVFIKGVPVSLETRHTQLYEKYRNRPRPAAATR